MKPSGDDTRRRAQFLTQVTSTLYPPTAGAAEQVEYIAVPDLRHPRLLVPAASRFVAAAALRHYARPATFLSRAKRDTAVAALLSGTERFTLPHRIALSTSGADFAAHLRRVLGITPHLAIHIGPSRANRKPIVQILNTAARTIGFAKLGGESLTRELVHAETHALRTLAGVRLRHLRIPQVLHSGEWRAHSVLIQEALPGWRTPRRRDLPRLSRAMRELHRCVGIEEIRLADSDYASTLHKRLEALAGRECVDSTTLVEAGTRLLDIHGGQRLCFGAWHGDWSPWNMALLPDAVLLWDFERFAIGVPSGFDALHYTLQRDIVTRSVDPTTAVLSLLASAPSVLTPFDVRGESARLTALLYLVDLAARYLSDRQAEAGAPLGALGTWLLPTLLRHVAAEGGIAQP